MKQKLLTKGFIFQASSLGLIGLVISATALASTSASVAATVTVQNVSVSVSSGSITYGTLASNVSKSTTAADLNKTQTATNNGNVTEDLTIKGQNSSNWTLASSNGSDQYTHKFCTSGCTNPPTSYTALSTSYQSLTANVAANSTQNFDLQLTTPNPSTVFTQQSVDVTILATAH